MKILGMIRRCLSETEQACRQRGLSDEWEHFLNTYCRGLSDVTDDSESRNRTEVLSLFRSMIRREVSRGLGSEVEIDRELERLARKLSELRARGGQTADAEAMALEPERASNLLRLGVVGAKRPVDQILERLRQPDGETWLESTLRGIDPESHESLEPWLHGGVSLGKIIEIKDRAKTWFVENVGDDDAQAILVYFVCVAAALAHHGELVSTRAPKIVNEILRDLAATVPGAWSDLFLRGAARLVPRRMGPGARFHR